MRRILLTAAFGLSILAGCIVYSGPQGSGVVVAPLPAVVELDIDPFYFYRGFYYHYHDDHHWSYSPHREGPWKELPRGHYPKETKWKKKGPGWKYRY